MSKRRKQAPTPPPEPVPSLGLGTLRQRVIALVAVGVVLVGGTTAYLVLARAKQQEAVRTAPAESTVSLAQVVAVPRIVFRNTAIGPAYGRVAMVHTGAMVCAGLFSIVFGRLLDRRGFFPIAVCGALATGTGLVLVSRATSFW